MKDINWKDVEESKAYARLTAGGYICKIVDVTDVPLNPVTQKGDYLIVLLDIADGKFKDYGTETEKRTGKEFGYIRVFRSYKESALGMFKSFLKNIERSNPDRFKADLFDNNEKVLIGLNIGVVLGEEEYIGNDGNVKLRTYADSLTSTDNIRKGKYKLPELKKAQQAAAPVTSQKPEPEDDEELPF